MRLSGVEWPCPTGLRAALLHGSEHSAGQGGGATTAAGAAADSRCTAAPSPLSALPSIPPALLGWVLILVGCCCNVLSLEFITQRDKGAGHLITFAQFLFISCEGFFTQFNFHQFRFNPRLIPLRIYFLLTILFVSASLLNNAALNWNISMPVHTVFRSSGLAGTLMTGYFFFQKKYTRAQVLSCLMVCTGVIVLTLADAHRGRKMAATECCGGVGTGASMHAQEHSLPSTASADAASSSSPHPALALFLAAWSGVLSSLGLPTGMNVDLRWLVGICMLTLTLLLLSVLGHIQDRTYASYGKVWREVMFYTHAVSLPTFLLFWKPITEHAYLWLTHPDLSVPVHLPWLPSNTTMPLSLWFILLCNLFTQSICFKGVSILTSYTSTLTCTVAMTLRKFLSLLLSIWWFQNEFTKEHWYGAVLVFVGIVAYATWGSGVVATAVPAQAIAQQQQPVQSIADNVAEREKLPATASSSANGRPRTRSAAVTPTPSPSPPPSNDAAEQPSATRRRRTAASPSSPSSHRRSSSRSGPTSSKSNGAAPAAALGSGARSSSKKKRATRT